MAKIFEVFTDLPSPTQQEATRIQAIASGVRTTAEANFLTSLAPYLVNTVLLKVGSLIYIASGTTVPDAYEGFAKGALFIKTDAADGTKGLYENIGTTSDCDFNKIGDITSAEIADGSITTAKLASALDLALVAVTNLKIEVGTPVNAVAAAQTLTLTGAIVPGVHAESVITSDATNVADADTVTIGSTVYRFKDTMAQAYDVKRGADAATSLDNLKAAINASGTPGTEYFTGTLAHPTVVATTNTDTTQKVVARIPGTAANSAATTETSAHLAWEDTTLGGGTGNSNPGVAAETVTIDGRVYSFVDVLSETNGAAAIAGQVLFGADSAAALDNLKLAINAGATAGTNYSTGTVVHATVNATTNTDTTQVVAANIKGIAGNSLATTETLTNGAWGSTVLAGGIDGTVGLAKKILADSSYLYVAIAANTIADANWRRVTLGSAF